MGQDLVDNLAAGKTVKFGYVRLESLIAPVGGGQAGYASTDNGYATFSEFTRDTAGLAEYGVSAGYCAVVDCSYGCGIRAVNSLSLADSSSARLDAGSALAIQGPSSSSLPKSVYPPGFYSNLLSATGRFLWSDLNYIVSGTGGNDVGSFSVMARTGLPGVSLKGIKGSQTLPLSGDLTVEWTGGDTKLQNGQVTIGAYSQSNDLRQLVGLQCTAPVAAQKFTIPGWILSTLPPSGTGYNTAGAITYPLGWLWIGQFNKPTEFSADNLDRGILTDVFYNGLAIYFK